MIVAKIQVSGVHANVVYRKIIPTGIVGAQVELDYAEDIWHGLHKTVVFRGTVTKDVVTDENLVMIPPEVVATKGSRLRVGVYGVDASGNIAIPTLWANLGTIWDAANPSGDTTTDPSLPVWAQIQAMIGDLRKLDTTAKENLVAAVNEALTKGGGEVDPAEIQRIVEDYLAANPPAPGEPGKDGRGITSITGNEDGSWQISYNDGTTETVSNEAYQAIQEKLNSLSEEIADGVSWNELKDKPFYLEKTLFIELTKDDFVPDNEGRPFYTSSPKLDWMTSIDNVSIELNLVYNNGTSYVITENSFGMYFETIREDDGREHVDFGDDENFDIFSGPEDSFSIYIWDSYEDLAEIHLALYRKDIKKIPSILVDATIGKTAFNVAGYKVDETTGDDVFVEVPAINIPVSASYVSETDVFYDTERNCLKIPAKIIPWNGTCQIRLNYALSNVVGNDTPFSLKEGDAEWEYLDHFGGYYTELLFYFIPSNSSLSFMVKKHGSKTVTALAISEFGYVYSLRYTYSTDYKTISGAIRRIL